MLSKRISDANRTYMSEQNLSSENIEFVKPASKERKEQLVAVFKSEGFIVPKRCAFNTMYSAAVVEYYGGKVYKPTISNTKAPDYNIRGPKDYEIKDEAKQNRIYAAVPGDAVKLFCENSVFMMTGMPLWCEESDVDLHYHLMVLQSIDPTTYNRLKDKKHTEEHFLTLGRKSADYNYVQKKASSICTSVQAHFVRSMTMFKNMTSNLEEVNSIAAVLKTQLAAYASANEEKDGDNSGKNMKMIERLAATVCKLSSTTAINHEKRYFEDYVEKNRGALADKLKLRDPNDFPTPLMDQDIPMKSVEDVFFRLEDIANEYLTKPSPSSAINSYIKSYNKIPINFAEGMMIEQTAAEKPEIIKSIVKYISLKKEIPYSLLIEAHNSTYWAYNVDRRCFESKDERAPEIPQTLCYKFISSEMGRKLLMDSKVSTMASLPNMDQFICSDILENADFDTKSSYPIIISAMRQGQTMNTLLKSNSDHRETIFSLVENAFRAVVGNFEDEMMSNHALFEKRQKSTDLLFVPPNRLTPEIVKELSSRMLKSILENKSLAKFRGTDVEKDMKLTVEKYSREYAETYLMSDGFMALVASIASQNIEGVQKKSDSIGGSTILYQEIIASMKKLIIEVGEGDLGRAFACYKSLSSSGMSLNYVVQGEKSNVASTAAGNVHISQFSAAEKQKVDRENFVISLMTANTIKKKSSLVHSNQFKFSYMVYLSDKVTEYELILNEVAGFERTVYQACTLAYVQLAIFSALAVLEIIQRCGCNENNLLGNFKNELGFDLFADLSIQVFKNSIKCIEEANDQKFWQLETNLLWKICQTADEHAGLYLHDDQIILSNAACSLAEITEYIKVCKIVDSNPFVENSPFDSLLTSLYRKPITSLIYDTLSNVNIKEFRKLSVDFSSKRTTSGRAPKITINNKRTQSALSFKMIASSSVINLLDECEQCIQQIF